MWENFWFKQIDARQYAALRIAFGGLSAVYLIGLLPYVETQFSSLGWLGNVRQIAIQNGGSWSLFFIPAGVHATTVAYAIVLIGIVSAFLLMIGWQSRLTACITWLVWVSVWNRNPLLLDGDDAVLKVMCFYLLLSPCGNCWSVDACLHKMPEHVAVWPLRLIQFQIALLYFVSGWVKFQSPEWLDGTIMQYVLIHPQYSRWDGWVVHRQAVNDRIIGRTGRVYQMVGVAVSILASQCLYPEGKPSDRRPVSFGFAADDEPALVSGHYAVALSGVVIQ